MRFVLSALLLASVCLILAGCDKKSPDNESSTATLSKSAQAKQESQLPRQHDVELVYVAADGSEQAIAMRSPDVAEVRMTVNEGTDDAMRCTLEHISSSENVDQFTFTYTNRVGVSRSKTVTFSGQEQPIVKTGLDTYPGSFLLRPPK